MEAWQLLLLTLGGVVAGWLNVMAGGGSLLTLPIMLFMGLPGPVANGTNRLAIVAQNIAAVYGFFRKGFADFKLSLSLSLVASIGAAAGAMLGVRLEGVWFERVLALVMIAVMLLMLLGKQKSAERPSASSPKRLWLGHLCMIGAGFWGGFIQVGVGFILMPILHRVMGLDLVRVNMHKVFVALVYSLVALAVFASQLDLVWSAGISLALGNAIGGWFGAHSSVKHGEVWIKRVMYVTLSVMIVKLLFF
jgi:uncharacterized membrane protein YfcA